MIGAFAIAWIGLSPPAETHSKADLDALLRVAEVQSVQLYGRCGSEGAQAEAGEDVAKVSGRAIDREAERGFLRVAEIRRMVIESYPYARLGRDGTKYHNDDVHVAVQQFEFAYACNPGWEQRRYLDSALDMVLVRRKQLQEEKRADSEVLLEDERRLREVLRGLGPPACEATAPPCPQRLDVSSHSEPPRRGYRGRFMDILALRLDLGGGFRVRLQGPGGMETYDTAFVMSVAPGVRLLAGKRERHVFGLGFRYNLFAFVGHDDHASQLSARFEYGVRADPKWFSIHGSFEPGIQSHPKSPNFGHTHLGGAGSLCTWNEALCLRVGGSRSVVPSEGTYFDVMFTTFGVDVFRVVDNRLRGGIQGCEVRVDLRGGLR